ncbi:MAG: TonB-dependent receptor [Bacteroidota bacterium]
MNKHLYTIGFLCLASICFGQRPMADSIYHLPAVLKSAEKLDVYGGSKSTNQLDSLENNFSDNDNLSERLDALPVSIRSYGAGSLATISLRGKGAGHSAVLWEGFNLQNVMNGVVDISLIPTSLFDEMTLQSGGSAAMFGSGAIGGTIQVGNRENIVGGTQLRIGASFGSFSDYRQWVQTNVSKANWMLSVKGFNHTAKNNFSFLNPVLPGQPIVKLTNATTRNSGVLSSFAFRPSVHHKLSFHLWVQDVTREIPPSLTEIFSEASQRDQMVRGMMAWRVTLDRAVFKLRAGYFDEYIGFTDPGINLEADNRSKNFVSEGELTFHFHPQHRLNFGVGHYFASAETDNYAGRNTQHRLVAFSHYKLSNRNKRLSGTVALRQALVDGETTPLTASIGSSVLLPKGFLVKGNVNRTYRIPTFNDLFWIPGGNPDLKPESGWDMDVKLAWHQKKQPLRFRVEVAAFNSQVRNWIQWLPNNQGIWSPGNVNKVWSRGLEYESVIGFLLNKKRPIRIDLRSSYALVISTNSATGPLQENALDKQLIYVPKHNFRSSLSFGLGKFNLRYLHQFTGKSFTTSDNENAIDGFHLGKLDISQSINSGHHKWRIHLKINNLWDANYERVAFRPMPGRHFQASIIYTFKNIKDNAVNF